MSFDVSRGQAMRGHQLVNLFNDPRRMLRDERLRLPLQLFDFCLQGLYSRHIAASYPGKCLHCAT